MYPDEAHALWASAYEKGYPENRRDSYTRTVLEQYLSKQRKRSRLIDVGCGYCDYLDIYMSHCDDIALVDVIDLSSYFSGIEKASFVRCSVLDLDQCIRKQFDVVVCSKVIHNIPRRYHENCMEQIKLVSAQDSLVFITVASINDPARLRYDTRLPSPDHDHEYITGLQQGLPTYRYYFDLNTFQHLVAPYLDVVSISEFAAPSGLPNHQERVYWMLVAHHKQ